MGVKVIHNLPYGEYIRIAFVERLFDLNCPTISGAILSNHYISFICRRVPAHKYFSYAVSNLFAVNAFRLSKRAFPPGRNFPILSEVRLKRKTTNHKMPGNLLRDGSVHLLDRIGRYLQVKSARWTNGRMRNCFCS